MPKSNRRFRKSSIAPRNVPPVHDEEQEKARYCREILGLPGPIDCWVAVAVPVANGFAEPLAKPISLTMVRCLLTVEFIQVRERPTM